MRTAVVILNWNTRDYLDRFLPPLLDSLRGLNAGVVVADNASGDGSRELPDSELLWRVPNGTHYEIGPTPLVEIGGSVLTPTDKGNLFCLSLEDGSLKWIHKISVALINPLEVWEERGQTYILASAMDGVVTLLRVKNQL